jgi:hypothetical protein
MVRFGIRIKWTIVRKAGIVAYVTLRVFERTHGVRRRCEPPDLSDVLASVRPECGAEVAAEEAGEEDMAEEHLLYQT